MKKIKNLLDAVTRGRDDSRQPVIVYGPYDAIWPTVGVEGFSWFCEWCGRGDHDPAYGDRLDAALGASDHRNARHGGEDFTITEVFIDKEEVR